MFIQDNLQKLKVFSEQDFPQAKFLMMFIGVVITPLVLFAIGGRSPDTLWQSGLVWTFSVIGLLIVISMALDMVMYRSQSYESKPPSIATKIA